MTSRRSPATRRRRGRSLRRRRRSSPRTLGRRRLADGGVRDAGDGGLGAGRARRHSPAVHGLNDQRGVARREAHLHVRGDGDEGRGVERRGSVARTRALRLHPHSFSCSRIIRATTKRFLGGRDASRGDFDRPPWSDVCGTRVDFDRRFVKLSRSAKFPSFRTPAHPLALRRPPPPPHSVF